MEWKLADAKNRFSELVNKALHEGPQRVQRRRESVIVVSEAEFTKLAGKSQSFKDFLLQKGASLDGVDLSRDRSSGRDVSL